MRALSRVVLVTGGALVLGTVATTAALVVADPTAPPASADFTKACTSSFTMRPLRALPRTRARSTPNSRANARTAGLA